MCKMLICVLFLVSVVTCPAVTRITEHTSSTFKTPTPKPRNCILPSYPNHGTYEVSNLPSARPGQSFENFVLTVSCQQGYGLLEPDGGTGGNGTQTVYCVDGVMYQNISECVLFCKLDPDPSVRFMCQIPGTNGSKTCKHYVAPGTIVNPVCNTPNYYSSEILRYMKCIGGSWDYIAQCKPGLPENRTDISIQIKDVNNNNNNKISVNLGSSSTRNNNENLYNFTNKNIYENNNRYVIGITTTKGNSIDSFHVNLSNKNNNEVSLTVGSGGTYSNNNNKYNLTNDNIY